MKRFILVLASLLCAAAIFFSCDKPEPVEEPAEINLTLNTSLVKFDKAGGVQTVELTTEAQAWMASIPADCDWCCVDPASGAGNATLTLTAKANPETSRRTSILTLSAEGAKDLQISLSQDAQEKKAGLYSDPEKPDADSPCTIYYAVDKSSPLYGKKDLYAHIGINEWSNVQADWGTNLDKCKLTETDEANVWSLKIEPSVREWFGVQNSEVFRIAVVVRTADGTAQSSDMFLPVTDTRFAFVPDEVVEEALPSGAKHGINYNSDGSVTFVLYEADEDGNCYDWCYLIGEFNGWERKSEYAMKRDNAASCWWITCTGFESGKEYMFQYMAGDEENRLRLSDPYSEITYSGDDQWISSNTYPDLRKYPSETSGYVSAFEIGRSSYSWEVSDFKVEDSNDLVIYELLLRDFTEYGGKEGNLEGALAKLDYLEMLGVNAIELMPVQEFDGNDSWGYNPNHYFAMDKAYGTREMYKKFIDECHRRGIAVLFDVVYNHLTGASTLAKMYFRHCRTGANNPWFNQVTPHPYGVYHDLNHADPFVSGLVKESLVYLLNEYKIDGFRFDLTKGFTNVTCDEGSASWYKEDRVGFLKGYYDAIHAANPNAVMICEHFCDATEEQDLGNHGIQLWRQVNSAYCQAAMGYPGDSDFSYLHTESSGMPFGSIVSFMESHDEERLCYKQKAYSPEGVKDNLEVRMRRAGLCAAFSLLVPGPKMIWQFGELGYDYSINQNEDGKFHDTDAGGYRTANKPIRWDYFDDGVEGEGEDEVRRGLYDTYSQLLAFRKKNSAFYDFGAGFRWYVSADEWPGRYMFISTPDGSANMAVFGNFGSGVQNIGVQLPHDGTWYNAFTGDQWNGADHTCPMEEGKFYVLVDNQDAVMNWTPGSDPAPDPTPDPGPGTGGETPEGQVRIYLSSSWGWPYIWCWDSNGAQIFEGASWPGTRYHGEENGYYYWDVPQAYVGKTVSMLAVKEDQSEQTSDYTGIVLDKSVYFYLEWTSELGCHLIQENK